MQWVKSLLTGHGTTALVTDRISLTTKHCPLAARHGQQDWLLRYDNIPPVNHTAITRTAYSSRLHHSTQCSLTGRHAEKVPSSYFPDQVVQNYHRQLKHCIFCRVFKCNVTASAALLDQSGPPVTVHWLNYRLKFFHQVATVPLVECHRNGTRQACRRQWLTRRNQHMLY